MAEHVKKMGLACEYMNRVSHLLYSDRMKGINHFESQFGCGHAHCIVHIIKNIKEHCAKTPGAKVNICNDIVHKIQQAATEEECNKLIDRFARGFPVAAQYLRKLQKDCPQAVFQYAIAKSGYKTSGHRTSNIAEIMNNVLKEDRIMDCYRLGDKIVKWWGKKVAERQDICHDITRKQKLYTPYAATMIGKQERFAREGDFSITRQGNGIYLIEE